ncbi:hypothetical protein ZEAMMB73_Zm00001d036836 [Zea mays]|uniref:Biogenesis of lysosome-related organelles complex 1 subunit 1 n=1 Tax=Zea mays TaxID=4577 RepID=A0A1D6LS40_MAIZE|nr:hypothetical protein ZEAMMB73_Zm00001d036836 [Zea mays]
MKSGERRDGGHRCGAAPRPSAAPPALETIHLEEISDLRDGRSQASGGREAGPGRGAAPYRAAAPPPVPLPTTTNRYERAKKDALKSAVRVADLLVDTVDGGVRELFVNEKRIELEARALLVRPRSQSFPAPVLAACSAEMATLGRLSLLLSSTVHRSGGFVRAFSMLAEVADVSDLYLPRDAHCYYNFKTYGLSIPDTDFIKKNLDVLPEFDLLVFRSLNMSRSESEIGNCYKPFAKFFKALVGKYAVRDAIFKLPKS